MPAGATWDKLRAMKKHTLEFLQNAYSVEDGTCCITGPSWALRRNKAPTRARAGKATIGKAASAKIAPGLRLRAAAGK